MLEINSQHANWFIISGPERENKKVYYECRCTCGNIARVRKEVLDGKKCDSCTKCRYSKGGATKISAGDKFGKWEVIQEISMEEKRKHFIVRCECGFIRVLKGIRLRFGDSIGCRSCGSSSHKMSATPTYATWESMIQRCMNPGCTNYKHYGARGIKIDPMWLEFDNFHADMGDRPEGKELDRTDNDRNYEKSNCRWVSHQENLNNRVRNIKK